jgi:ribosomal protein S28E/S33
MRVRQLVVRVLGQEAIHGARQVHVAVLHGRALAAVLRRVAELRR